MSDDTKEEWTIVTKNDKKRTARGSKKKAARDKGNKGWQIHGTRIAEKAHMSESELERVISMCQIEIESTTFLAALEETALRGPPPSSIVCYGIGNFGIKQFAPSASMWQLVCALELRKIFQRQGLKISMYYFEPFMTSDEEVLLGHLSINVIRENERGRRVVKEPTFFFMPHCPLGLYSNVLFENRKRLVNVVILGNSLVAYANRLQKSCHRDFLQQLQPFWSETTIDMPKDEIQNLSGHFQQAFNDQAVTRFEDTQGLELSEALMADMLREDDECAGEVV